MTPRTDLRLYAAITVGEHVGVSRADMLSLVTLTEAEWEEERAIWSRTIAQQLDSDETFLARHDAAILEARVRLGRTVEPLESDLEAWSAFLGQWARAVDPATWVQSLGLTWLDVTRLQGVWGRRLAENEPLRRSMSERLVAEPSPLPPLVIAPWPVARAFAGLPRPGAREGSGAGHESSAPADEGEADVSIFEPLPGKAPSDTRPSSDRLKR